MAESVDLRADLTSSYELLLWLTMYRPRLSKVQRARTKGAIDPLGGMVPGPEGPVLPKGDKGTMNLLQYLALRFFGMGRIEGEGGDAKLSFSDEELLTVYKSTEELCAKLFAPRPAQMATESSGLETTLSQSLEAIRFVVMPYHKK
jgi:hypothetical protein